MYRRTGAPPCFVARQNSNFLTKMKRTLHLHKTTSTSIASSSRAIRILVSSRTNYTVLQRMENCRFTTVPHSSSFSSFPLSLSLSLLLFPPSLSPLLFSPHCFNRSPIGYRGNYFATFIDRSCWINA